MGECGSGQLVLGHSPSLFPFNNLPELLIGGNSSPGSSLGVHALGLDLEDSTLHS